MIKILKGYPMLGDLNKLVRDFYTPNDVVENKDHSVSITETILNNLLFKQTHNYVISTTEYTKFFLKHIEEQKELKHKEGVYYGDNGEVYVYTKDISAMMSLEAFVAMQDWMRGKR